MIPEWNLLILINLGMVTGGFLQELDLSNYEHTKGDDFRRKFIENKRHNLITNQRTNILDKSLFNNTVYLDGIIHYEINENNTNINKIKTIEDDFKRISEMQGVTHKYKRGFKWRTWRQVAQDGGKKIICYVCDSIVKGNCTHCHNDGHWIIEDKPPCPYELFSLKNENIICAKNFAQYSNTTDDCPSEIKFEELGVGCDNPIETIWRISRDYKSVKSYAPVLCNGKEFCDITTVYTIDTQGISFRMINSSNIIFYSRVMRNGRKNYACVNDCGFWDANTKKIIAQQKPLSFNLLEKNKKKREDVLAGSIIAPRKWTKKCKKIIRSKNKLKNYIEKNKTLSMVDKSAGSVSTEKQIKSTSISYCKKLEKKEKDYIYDYETSDYEY